MSHSTSDTLATPTHLFDQVSLGKIVQIRDQLLATQAAGKPVFRFESGDPSFAPPAHVIDAINAAARAGKTHYVSNNGIPELREALAQKVVAKNRIEGITANDVFVTNGAIQALFTTFSSLLSPGDEVLIPDPMWTETGDIIRLTGGVPRRVPIRADRGFTYRPEDIEAAITPRTAVIFLNTPHNPTGAVLGRETLLGIIDVARRHNLWIISDEAYEDIIFAPNVHYSTASLAGDYAPRVISVFSFSKSHALAGLRIGCVVTRSSLLRARLPKILRCSTNGVNSLAQWGALAAVTGNQDHIAANCAAYLERRDIMLEALRGIPGVHPFTPEGTFFIWADLDPALYERLEVRDADALSKRLASDGIGSVPGDAFGATCEDAIRLSFSCDTKMVREGSALLRGALS